jgi:hypothetical protein
MTSRAVYTPSNIMAGHKRKLTNESTPSTFIDTSGPPQKQAQHVAQTVENGVLQELWNEWQAK